MLTYAHIDHATLGMNVAGKRGRECTWSVVAWVSPPPPQQGALRPRPAPLPRHLGPQVLRSGARSALVLRGGAESSRDRHTELHAATTL